MKNKILFLFALAVMAIPFSAEATNSPESDLKKSVTELVRSDVFNILGENEEAEVRIKFFINKESQIRVISVNTENPAVRAQVIKSLEHAPVDGSNLLKKFHYNLTITFLHPRV
ncbi:MAG: hypothetical protein GVX96_04905 [Bacteroidetes bacterium]|jgi:TusA-related sulfurtransferase|nr:hypothetical protein [Bacteroidota bacterium]